MFSALRESTKGDTETCNIDIPLFMEPNGSLLFLFFFFSPGDHFKECLFYITGAGHSDWLRRDIGRELNLLGETQVFLWDQTAKSVIT